MSSSLLCSILYNKTPLSLPNIKHSLCITFSDVKIIAIPYRVIKLEKEH